MLQATWIAPALSWAAMVRQANQCEYAHKLLFRAVLETLLAAMKEEPCVRQKWFVVGTPFKMFSGKQTFVAPSICTPITIEVDLMAALCLFNRKNSLAPKYFLPFKINDFYTWREKCLRS